MPASSIIVREHIPSTKAGSDFGQLPNARSGFTRQACDLGRETRALDAHELHHGIPTISAGASRFSGPQRSGRKRKLSGASEPPKKKARTENEKEALLARLDRAAARQRRRKGKSAKKRGHDIAHTDFTNIKKANDNRIRHRTPFGTMRLGRGMFNAQPFGTFFPDDWENKPTMKHNYDEIAKTLDGLAEKKREAATSEMLDFMGSTGDATPTKQKLTRKEKVAATGLITLLSAAEPHSLRNPVGGKPERAALRYARKHGFKKTFNRKSGAYTPAWATAAGAPKGGTGAWREMRQRKRDVPSVTFDLLDEMSSSSEEDDDDL